MVDEKTLQELEFDTILEMLRKKAFSDYGKVYFNSFKKNDEPQNMFKRVEYVLKKLDEISDVFYSVKDVRPHLMAAKEGEILDREALTDFFNLFKVSQQLAQILSGEELDDISKAVKPPEAFFTMFTKTFSPDGSIKDNATPELSKIRKELRSLERQINEKVKTLLFEGVNKGYISEALILQRHERYVLPVKASKRNMVKGIVHGQSSTLSTYYVEPEELIGLNDSLILTRSQEIREISKILSNMTKFLVDNFERISLMVSTLEEFDALCARARYAKENDCITPELRNDGGVVIVNGRNPLIPPEKVVPINFEMRSEDRVIILSGPNTGGKTATLKTVGTFVLMSLMGIPLPSGVGTQISLFDSVFSDIGDDQSIKDELSTFSAKVKREDEICRNSNEMTLALIDEMGDGTEPTEGVAFAKAVIDLLLKHNARAIVTTHLPELKTLALEDIRIRNASVGFDVNRLMPTYKIHMDMPGKSHAFEIIKKMGVSQELVKSFEKNRSVDRSKTDVLVERLQASIQEYDKKHEEILEKEKELKKQEIELNEKMKKLKDRRLEELDENIKELSQKMASITKEMERAIHLLKTSDDVEDLRRENKKLIELKKEMESISYEENKSSPQIKVGSPVEIEGTGVKGVVVKINEAKKKVVVDTGSVQVEIDLGKIRVSKNASKKSGKVEEYSYEGHERPSTEIDIRGMTVEDALPIVEEFSDRVLKFKTVGYIIHGKGTGRLANGIWEFLRSKRIPFRIGKKEEGGTGVTVIGGE
ncbi:endonuclease MutS2 [Mesoaciditoga lauensis]|uniref:endonuclease MutS2 n=1 Tax=Mesoaciditoga lauensis TaxID=1495039 RepID=UPI00056C808C|nr:Smr/MutS family protein [Mesoaciditoga lauensis]